MKLLKFCFFLVALGLMGCADNFDVFHPDDTPDPEPPAELDGDVSNFFKALQDDLPSETFTYYEDWWIQLVTDRESIIEFPRDAFVDQNGNPVTGFIDVEVLELRSAGEILLYGIPTESHGNMLESGGEFHISASQNGKPLKLAPGAQVLLRVPDNSPKQEMELWYGKEVATDPITGAAIMTWDEADDDPSTWDNVNTSEWTLEMDSTGQGGFISGFGYECFSDSLNWINIDLFMNLDESEITDACVTLPDGFGNTNSAVFIIFEDFNGIIALPGNPDEMQFCNYYTNYIKVGVPLGAPVKFLVISELGEDCYLFDMVQTVIEENHVEELTPEKMSFEDIKDIIMNL